MLFLVHFFRTSNDEEGWSIPGWLSLLHVSAQTLIDPMTTDGNGVVTLLTRLKTTVG